MEFEVGRVLRDRMGYLSCPLAKKSLRTLECERPMEHLPIEKTPLHAIEEQEEDEIPASFLGCFDASPKQEEFMVVTTDLDTNMVSLQKSPSISKHASMKPLSNPFDDSADDEGSDDDEIDERYYHVGQGSTVETISAEEPGDLASAPYIPLNPFSTLGDGDEGIDHSDNSFDSDFDSDDDDFDHLYSHDGPPNSANSNGQNSDGGCESSKSKGERVSFIFENGIPTPPPSPKHYHTYRTRKMSPRLTAVADDHDEYFRPTIRRGQYANIATNAFEEKIVYIIIDLDSQANEALNRLRDGFPPETIPNRLSKCSWRVKPLANNRRLLDNAARSSPIPLIRLTTPTGVLCQLEEKAMELRWDFEAYVEARDDRQEQLEAKRQKWIKKERMMWETLSASCSRLDAEEWWANCPAWEAERLRERVKESERKMEKKRRDKMRVYRMPSLDTIDEEEVDNNQELTVKIGWKIEFIRRARRMALEHMKGSIDDYSASCSSDDEDAIYWSSDESDFDSAESTDIEGGESEKVEKKRQRHRVVEKIALDH